MLVRDLVRLGRPFRDGGMALPDVITLISDIANDQARNFMARVLVAEVDHVSPGGAVAIWPDLQWGDYVPGDKGNKQIFRPAIQNALAAPFIVPGRGNPLKPQGVYGIASYPIYEAHFQDFAAGSDGVGKFLAGRISRTVDLRLNPTELSQISEGIHKRIAEKWPDWQKGKEKTLGVLVIAAIDPGGCFLYHPADEKWDPDRYACLGLSQLHPDQAVLADLSKLVGRMWLAKREEGKTLGSRKGKDAVCAFCQSAGEVVSIYSKSWSWFSTTWSAPLSIFLDEKQQVEGIAICPACYESLTYGSNQLAKLTRRLPNWLTREIFAPPTSPEARKMQAKKQMDTIYAGAYALPVLDTTLDDEFAKDDFIRGIEGMAQADSNKKTANEIHLDTLLGMETILPEEFAKGDLYRLTALYYSGEPGRGDIHLHAVIEDVVPSVARELDRIMWQLPPVWQEIKEHWGIDWENPRYLSSLPSLLSHAYGPSYIWQSLEKTLHRRPLSRRVFIQNAAGRLAELGRTFPRSLFDIRREVAFWQVFGTFLQLYNEIQDANRPGKEMDRMRHWKELNRMMETADPELIEFHSVAELGYGVGYVTGEFARYYYRKTERDYMEHRVFTFGSALTPDAIWKRSLNRMLEYAGQLKMPLREETRKQIAAVQAAYLQYLHEDRIQQQRDEFMTAFWAGYTLGRKAKEPELGETATTEAGNSVEGE